MQNIEKELESLRTQVAMLEELVALRAKVDELTRQLAPEVPVVPYVPVPYIPPYVPAPAWPIYPSLPGRFIWATHTEGCIRLEGPGVETGITYQLSNTVNGPEA